MIVPLNRKMAGDIGSKIQDRDIDKTYLAVCVGIPRMSGQNYTYQGSVSTHLEFNEKLRK